MFYHPGYQIIITLSKSWFFTKTIVFSLCWVYRCWLGIHINITTAQQTEIELYIKKKCRTLKSMAFGSNWVLIFLSHRMQFVLKWILASHNIFFIWTAETYLAKHRKITAISFQTRKILSIYYLKPSVIR